jgi:hypothetical protein
MPAVTDRARLAGVLLLALAIRLAFVALPVDWSASDTEGYAAPARSLALGKGYLDAAGVPTAERPPGYPTFLAPIYVFSTSPRAVGIAQALLGTATVALLARLLRRRFPRAALPAAFLLAIDPIALGVVPFVLREALLLFLLTLLLVLLEELRDRRLAQGLAAGAGLAALALTHQLYMLLGPFLFLGALLTRSRKTPLLVAGAITLLALAGWSARNRAIGSTSLALTSYPVPAGELWLVTESTNDWLHDDPTTGFQELHFREIGRIQRAHPGDMGAVKAELYGRAWENLRRDPLTVLARAARINLWFWLEVPGSVKITLHPRLWLARIVLIPFVWLRLFWAIVAIVELRRRHELATLGNELATLAFFVLAPALLLPIPRYLAPLTAVLDALAVIGILLYRQRRLTESATPVERITPPSPVSPGP